MAPVSIAQLECDYADCKDCVDTPANMRIIAAMPAVLEVLNAAIKYKESGGDDWYGQIVCTTVDRLLD